MDIYLQVDEIRYQPKGRKKMKKEFSYLVTTSIAALLLPAGMAHAQADTSEEESARTLGVVTVTAQKREERAVDVPISVVTTTGETLEALNLTAATDLQYTTPGLNLGDANTPRGAGLRIRGIRTNVFADGIEQNVGTVVDGVPLARAGQGLADLTDIERVEVLRGPQGMLFGRNASAGLINIVTRGPTDDLSVQGNAAVANDGVVNVSAGLSGPIVKNVLTGRISGYTNQRDGFVARTGEDSSLNDRNEFGFRGALKWDASEDFELTLRADYSERDNECCIWTPRAFADATSDPRPGAGFLSTALPGVTASSDNLTIGDAADTIFNKVISQGVSGEVNWEFGDYTFTSLTAFRTWRQKDNNDADLSQLNILDINFGANDLEQFSQEFRLTSPSDGPLEYVVGAFYYDSSNTGNFDQVGRFALSFAGAQAAGIDIPLAPGLALPASANFGRSVETVIDVEDFAMFGQATYYLTEQLSLIVGGRYPDTSVSMDYARVGTPGNNAFNFLLGGAFAPLEFDVSTSDTNLSWRLGAQYALGEDANLYATVSRGYKGPGFNNLLDIVIPTGQTEEEFTLVDPEIPTSYEIGYKAILLDGRVSVDTSVYRTEFEDFQAQIVETPQGAAIGSFAIRNAGELLTQGIELQVTAAPRDEVTLGFAAAFADSEFKSFQGASCPRLAGLVTEVGAPCGPLVAGGANATSFDASGLDGTNAPELTLSLDGRYQTPIFGRFEGFVQGNYYWRDDTTFGLYPFNVPNPTVQESYGILNASLGLIGNDGGYTVSLFARNMTDENFVTSIFDLPFDAAGGLGQFVTADAQRTIGVSLNVSY